MNRDNVLEKYKWDLSKIYKDNLEFKRDVDWVKKEIEKAKKYKNIKYDEKLLYDVIIYSMNLIRKLEKLEVYVSLLNDEDTGNNQNRELKEEVNNLVSRYHEETFFIDTDILKMNYDEILELIKKNPKLDEYKLYLEKMFRYQEHTLSSDEEKILSNMSRIMGNNYESYELLKDNDLSFPSFYVNDKEYVLDNTKYMLYIEDDNQLVRKNAFNNFYTVFKQYKNIFANLFISSVKEGVFLAKVRKYDSAIGASVFKDEVDVSIYNNLISSIHEKMDVLYKFYALKKKVLKLDELHLYDVYVNLIPADNFKYPARRGIDTVIKALSILGDEYGNILKEGINKRWIDFYPNKGKRTGGYSSGCYDTYPYILLNYQDKYDDMSTLAHELGHSIHSYYTRKYNPFQYGSYTIFVAEVASTVNELLLAKYVIKNSSNREEKLFILNRIMELYRATIYRQTMFAEFERDVYHDIENDLPITADILCKKYDNLNKAYFGDDVCVDELIQYEWERIPHFYYDFYVYKYATGLSAASYIVNGLLKGTITSQDYINFLKCGRSKTPLDSLKVCGVDLTKPDVIYAAVEMFNDAIDEFTELYYQ